MLKPAKLDSAALAARLQKGDRVALAQAITLAESSLEEHQTLAGKVLKVAFNPSHSSKRLAITGVPGAGKSTFINALGTWLCKQGKKVAVLSIDPSSEKSKGSILGDKTRMEELSREENAFIRPSPSSGELGGIGRRTREAILLCEAAGYEIILIETVGVGQSETEAQHLSDIFLLLLVTGAGDDLQGIKRGIMELADIVVINKADGANAATAGHYRQTIANSVHLFPAMDSGWIPQTLLCSSTESTGIEKVWNTAISYFEKAELSGYFQEKRKNQNQYWLHRMLEDKLIADFYNSPVYKTLKDSPHNELSTTQDIKTALEQYYASLAKK